MKTISIVNAVFLLLFFEMLFIPMTEINSADMSPVENRVLAIVCALPIFKNMTEVKSSWANLAINIWLLVLFLLSTAALASSTYNPFIYFRF